jgi:hypothetical protein
MQARRTATTHNRRVMTHRQLSSFSLTDFSIALFLFEIE